jgi:hypothetical protein
MSDDQKNHDIDRVKKELKERYSQSDYEELIEFAAKYFVSDQRRKREMDNFHNAMLGMEFAKADENKEAQKKIEETYKNNSLFEAVMHVNFYAGQFRSWGMNARRHANDRKAKKLVLDWWEHDKSKYRSKTDVVGDYLTKLNKLGLRPKPKKDYDYETIYTWLTGK